MSVYISKSDKKTKVRLLPDEIRNEIMVAVEASLDHQVKTSGQMPADAYQKAWDAAFNSRVCDLDKSVLVEFVDEKLTYYVVENLRYEQDKTGGWKLTRYDNLPDALAAFAALPKEYTTALGASLTGGKFGVGEIDLVHRKNGDVVLVNDFKFIERWDNPLVRRAVTEVINKLGVAFESDLRLFGGKTVLVPLQPWEPQKLNSYFMDKYLRPAEGAEQEAVRRYGDPAMYGADHPVHSEYLLSSIDEVFLFGGGWLNGKDFLAKLNSIDEYASPARLKVMNININYVDINGREGQADISPADFALLKKQTVERTAKHPDLDAQIEAANKIRMEQMNNKSKDKSKHKGRDESSI